MSSDANLVLDPDQYSIELGQLVGNYRLEKLLAQGGMGAVFAAVHKDIGRRAAVKVLSRAYARDPEFATRFINEARAVNLIAHPGVVEIFEFGRLPDETPYIIMEFLSGESMASRLVAGARRDFRTSLEWCRQIALALSAAHKQGIIHRDLKPENVFLVPDQVATSGGVRVKVLDFGIAKVSPSPDGQGMVVTQPGSTMGSPLYMSPEQCYEMGAVTDRADVYALGCMLYELLTGRPPFVARLPNEVMVMQVRNPLPPVRNLNPTVPSGLVALTESMLLKDPTKRPSMDEVAQQIDRLLADPKFAGSWPFAPPPKTLNRKAILGSGIALLVVMVGLGAVIFQRLKQARIAQTTSPPAAAPVVQPTAPPVAPPATIPKAEPAVDLGASPAAEASIHYELTSEPPGARIIDLDTNQVLGTTPTTLVLTRSDRPQRLTLRRLGFQDRGLVVERTRDGSSLQHLTALPRKRNSEELLAPKL